MLNHLPLAVLAMAGHEHSGSSGKTAMGAADVMSALPDSAVCVQGVGYPMFRTKALADAATSMGTSHAMKVGHMDKYTLYMPNGNLPGKIMCATTMGDHSGDGGGDGHSGHDHSHRRLAEAAECTCPPPGATGPTVDATKIINLPMKAFCMEGYYPMYATLALSNAASPKGTSHSHDHSSASAPPQSSPQPHVG